MSLLNRLRPKWQNSDPEVRVDAVRQLDKDDIELLTAVAQHDTDARVRQVAIKKLDAPRLLLELAKTEERAGNLEQAQQYYERMLAEHPASQLRGDAMTRSETLALAAEAISD